MASWGSLKATLGGVVMKPLPKASETLLGPKKRAAEEEPKEDIGPKFFKRKEKEEERRQQYLAEQEKKEQERKKKRMEWAGVNDSMGLELHTSHTARIPSHKRKVIQWLRDHGEPITLFGEDDAARLKRYHELLDRESQQDVKNELGLNLHRARMEKASREVMERDKARLEQGATAEEVEQEAMKKLEVEVTEKRAKLEEYNKDLEAMNVASPKDPMELREMTEEEMCKYVRVFIERVLLEWNLRNIQRPWDVQKSPKGRQETAKYEETVAFIAPLLKALKKCDVDYNIVDHFTKVAYFCLMKEYTKSMDFYLSVSIGNAQWPLGVTQVGIHSRVGRERISSNKQAHILNNETQRKFIQGVKRLITQMQHMHPTHYSKMIRDYV